MNRAPLVYFIPLSLLSSLFLPIQARAAAIVVDSGKYNSAELAAGDEKNVNWRDGDVADDTVCTQCFAATELQHYLKIMSGNQLDFPILDDEMAPESGDLIILGGPASNVAAAWYAGTLDLSKKDFEALDTEGYIIKSKKIQERRITLIAGGGRVGTLFGAYDFLHRLGVRWYAPGEINEEVPQKGLQGISDLEIREKPAFLIRGFHAWENRGNPEFLLWMARNRLNYWCVQQEEKPLLHKLGLLLSGGGHVLTELYLGPGKAYPYNHPRFPGGEAKPEDPYPVSELYRADADGDGKLSYFEAHPEWYALRAGKRSDQIEGSFGDNFCTSNKEAIGEWTKNAVEDLISGQYRDADIINAWMLDVGKWCECDSCKALGTPTDRNILVIHHYSQAIKKAQAEGKIKRPVRLLFLAYADVLRPPSRPLPADFDYDMAIATFFPIVRCYVHQFQDQKCSKNSDYRNQLKGWALDPDRHYKGQICIGEYYNVSGYKCLPICFMSTMARDIPYYYEQGARHFHYMHCTTGNWGNKALTNWQMARQLWDPGTDCQTLRNDYFNGRYGPAADQMRKFYESLEEMLCNVSEIKYGLARRLRRGDEDLFPTEHLKYERADFEKDDGPDLLEILAHGKECRRIIDGVLKAKIPPRIACRVVEDEQLFTYGERTLQLYDALCRSHFLLKEKKVAEAREAFLQAEALADLLKADTTSTKHSSSHANAPNALSASYAEGALERLRGKLGDGEKTEAPPQSFPTPGPAK